MDVSQLEAAITEKTRAIMPVHLYGLPADMDPILEIARRHKLVVIEDAAQAVGAEYHGRRAGSIGDIGCFSFYPTKNLGAAGEGGMVTTSNPEYDRHIRLLRSWGEERRYHPVLKGYNYRLQGIQAAILRVKLSRLETWTETRCELAAEYDRLLKNADVVCPSTLRGTRHVYCLYTIRAAHRDALQKDLEGSGIQTAVHYPTPIHLTPAYADERYKAGDFPVAEACAQTVLSLPLHAHMSYEQVAEVAGRVLEVTGEKSHESVLTGR
jgi:dTDP-4-amino-4,6-dideoxygalactose transaminase